jgi:hypothetical protein
MLKESELVQIFDLADQQHGYVARTQLSGTDALEDAERLGLVEWVSDQGVRVRGGSRVDHPVGFVAWMSTSTQAMFDRIESPGVVYSHLSALRFLGILDSRLESEQVSVVDETAQLLLKGMEVLHTGSEIVWQFFGAIPVTTPLQTLHDVAKLQLIDVEMVPTITKRAQTLTLITDEDAARFAQANGFDLL